MSWTDERVELLRKLWTDGLSASQVAAELGPGITRNAVIGKIHRLGLAERAKTASAQRPRAAKAPRPTHPRMNGVSSHGNLALAFTPHALAAPRLAPEEEVVIPMSERVTIDGTAQIHVPLADGRSDIAGVPLLRLQVNCRRRAVLRLSCARRLSAGPGSPPRARSVPDAALRVICGGGRVTRVRTFRRKNSPRRAPCGSDPSRGRGSAPCGVVRHGRRPCARRSPPTCPKRCRAAARA